VVGPDKTLSAGQWGGSTAMCPAGKKAVGGGYTGTVALAPDYSFPAKATARAGSWRPRTSTASQATSVHTRCASRSARRCIEKARADLLARVPASSRVRSLCRPPPARVPRGGGLLHRG
jgi:hypothetical protein